MTVFLVVLHVLVCVFLILFVLLQPGARGGVGAAFGGAGGQTVFGGRCANPFLAQLTAAGAVVFMLTSISLSYFGSRSTSVMDSVAAPAAVTGDKADKGDQAQAPPKADDAAAAPSAETAPEAAAPEGAAAPAPAGDAPPAP